MIRCKAVAEMLTSDQLRDASGWTRLQVRMHLWMCRHCARFARQMEQMRSAAARLAGEIDREMTGQPEDRLETRLLRKLSGPDR